ncbi:MAG: hypothetical protein J7K13_07135 [Thermoplasmata archaeon]|nr:hypothetical protein [Thermoplasmata archaeon]
MKTKFDKKIREFINSNESLRLLEGIIPYDKLFSEKFRRKEYTVFCVISHIVYLAFIGRRKVFFELEYSRGAWKYAYDKSLPEEVLDEILKILEEAIDRIIPMLILKEL